MTRSPLVFWLRRNISRLALVLGFSCIVELLMHFTEGTRPNTRMPLEYWPCFVAAVGLVSFLVARLTYIPPATHDPPPKDRADGDSKPSSAR